MKDLPLVSIVIPVHGECPYLEDTLRSVLYQTYKNYQIIVVDERAAPGINARVKKIAPNATIIKCHIPGAGAARNAGTSFAEGTWIAYLDADDLWMENKLEKQIIAAQSVPDVQVVCSSFYEFSSRNGKIICLRPRNRKIKKKSWLFSVLIDDIAIPSTALCAKNAVKSIGGWPNTRQFEDTKFFALMAAKFNFNFIDDPLVLYRRHDYNRSGAHKAGRYEAYMETIEFIKRVKPDLDEKLIQLFRAHAHFLTGHWHRASLRRYEAFKSAARAVYMAPQVGRHWFLLFRTIFPERWSLFLQSRANRLMYKN